MRAFETAHAAHQAQLNIERQAGRNPVWVNFVGGQPFRFEEYLVRRLVCEPVDLVFDRRAVARSDSFYDAGEHWRAIKTGTDDVVGRGRRMGDPAGQLTRMHFPRAKIRKHRGGIIARLNRQN